MRDIQRVYIAPKKIGKVIRIHWCYGSRQNILLVYFGEKKPIYQRGQAVLFFTLPTNTYTFDRCHKLAQHCARYRPERSYARCKYQHM